MCTVIKKITLILVAILLVGISPSIPLAAYLNDQNISVSLGSSMAPEPFNNLSTAASLANVIDAPSAVAPEDHLQSTHVWFTGASGLELDFDFGEEYDLVTLHFWNYFGEGFDVDNIDLNFFDSSHTLVGSLLNVEPALGGNGGNPIFAEHFPLFFPSNVQFVNAVLTGTNNQVDFNNIGFTGEPSPVPVPSAMLLFGTGLVGLVGWRWWSAKNA